MASESLEMTTERRPFAAGDYITRFSQNSEYALRIESPYEKRGWKARTSSSTGLLFPGSAIRFEDRYYEIYSIERASSAIFYYVKPWEERFPLRVQFHYTKEECRRMATEQREEKRQQKTRAAILLLAPFTGLLPEADQYRLQNRLGFQARTLTLISAICCLFPGGASLILFLAQLLGDAYAKQGVTHTALYLAGCYLLLESFVRIYTSMKLEEPMGSVFASLPIELLRSFSRKRDRKSKISAGKIQIPADEIVESNTEDYALEIISVLPKPDWNIYTGIRFGERWFGLMETKTEGEEKHLRYHFYLKEAPLGFCFRAVCEYQQNEAQIRFETQKRAARSTWVWTFPWLWGFLPEKDQDRLAELYDFDALKFTRITFIALGLFGIFNLAASVLNAAAHRFQRMDAILVIPALYLVMESAERWKQWRAGRPSGSVLGWLARPFAKRFLE